jgi:hypothetical protein
MRCGCNSQHRGAHVRALASMREVRGQRLGFMPPSQPGAAHVLVPLPRLPLRGGLVARRLQHRLCRVGRVAGVPRARPQGLALGRQLARVRLGLAGARLGAARVLLPGGARGWQARGSVGNGRAASRPTLLAFRTAHSAHACV